MDTQSQPKYAAVAKLVDAPDLGSGGVTRGGSSPSSRTIFPLYPRHEIFNIAFEMSDVVQEFLKKADWHDATIEWFGADWSVRSYARLTKPDGRTALLLKSPPDDSPQSMVGHQIGAWARMNKHFTSIGVNVPTIYAEDLSRGFILMQDFGDETIRGKGLTPYLKAMDILIQMRDHLDALNAPLIRYEDSHVYQALRFYPLYILNTENTDRWFNAWKEVEDGLPPCPRALTHMDFAAMNLMWTQDETVGVIDFQAACDGPFVYDSVNLLEDIRYRVDEDIKQSCKDHFRATLLPDKADLFDAWYPVITAQFHARILGQIQFLSREKGRDDLMRYYDDITQRFEKEIEHPTLKPIKDFL